MTKPTIFQYLAARLRRPVVPQKTPAEIEAERVATRKAKQEEHAKALELARHLIAEDETRQRDYYKPRAWREYEDYRRLQVAQNRAARPDEALLQPRLIEEFEGQYPVISNTQWLAMSPEQRFSPGSVLPADLPQTSPAT